MIYHLFEYLKDYDIPGQGLFTYLSFRAMLTSVTAMLLSFFAGRRIIRWLQKNRSERPYVTSDSKGRCRKRHSDNGRCHHHPQHRGRRPAVRQS